MADTPNFLELLHNPYGPYVHKLMFDILQGKYSEHKEIITRIAHNLHLKSDIEQFGKLIVGVYEAGFLKAISEHKKELERLGLNVNIKNPKPPTEKIFK